MKKITPRQISRFEQLARRLVEGSVSRLFGVSPQLPDLAVELTHQLEDVQKSGGMVSGFELYFHPAEYARLQSAGPDPTAQLSGYVRELTQQQGLIFPLQLTIQLLSDPDTARFRPRIKVNRIIEDEEMPTRTQQLDENEGALAELLAKAGFLIINGRTHYPLQQPTITIGRHTDNDIVLPFASVSRRQAQIRWRHGRFLLFDLNSRSGTFVNGRLVTQQLLCSGDVISVAQQTLIYGEGDLSVEHTPTQMQSERSE